MTRIPGDGGMAHAPHDHARSHDHAGHDHSGHDHQHGHGHHHRHDARSVGRQRLAWALALQFVYMLAEAVGGWMADSLALLADAGHMLSDVAALGLSLFALWLAQRPPTARHSYGYYRAEILAALVNGATLVGISLFIFSEAVSRFGQPHEVRGGLMIAVAIGGLIVNLAGMALLHGGRSASLNIRAAWLHLAADALGSVAALAAGGLVWARGWTWADPAASIVIGLLVIYSSWGLLQESVAILMESTPAGIDLNQVRESLQQAPGVRDVHDLHVWTITAGMVSLSAHVLVTGGAEHRQVLADIRSRLAERFGISHVTIQIEPDDVGPCESSF